MQYHYPSLNPDKSLIWRIVHRDNLPWIWENGLHCGNGQARSPNWVNIGNADLITKRGTHPVPVPPGGVLNDYVPFYFTPFSAMMLNIRTGRGVPQRANEEIVILVSSLSHLQNQRIPFLFTDMHAYYPWATFYSDPSDLDKIDWGILQRRDFRRDPDDPKKFERYQAEALAHRHCPVTALLGAVCYTESMKQQIDQQLAAHGLALRVYARTDWYFQ